MARKSQYSMQAIRFDDKKQHGINLHLAEDRSEIDLAIKLLWIIARYCVWFLIGILFVIKITAHHNKLGINQFICVDRRSSEFERILLAQIT